MNHFRFLTFLDTFSVAARLHKMNPQTWKGEPARGEPDICKSHSLLLRKHNKPSQDNWLEDLPLHDTDELKKWPSLNLLLSQARAVIYDDPGCKVVIDRGAPPGRVMLSALTKVNAIQWHTDNGPYHNRHIRFHIPLVTNPLCFVQVQNEQVHMEVGALWWFNNRFQHCAMNWGQHLRVHLIFEMPVLVKEDADA
jgi:hypothetical protein